MTIGTALRLLRWTCCQSTDEADSDVGEVTASEVEMDPQMSSPHMLMKWT